MCRLRCNNRPETVCCRWERAEVHAIAPRRAHSSESRRGSVIGPPRARWPPMSKLRQSNDRTDESRRRTFGKTETQRWDDLLTVHDDRGRWSQNAMWAKTTSSRTCSSHLQLINDGCHYRFPDLPKLAAFFSQKSSTDVMALGVYPHLLLAVMFLAERGRGLTCSRGVSFSFLLSRILR